MLARPWKTASETALTIPGSHAAPLDRIALWLCGLCRTLDWLISVWLFAERYPLYGCCSLGLSKRGGPGAGVSAWLTGGQSQGLRSPMRGYCPRSPHVSQTSSGQHRLLGRGAGKYDPVRSSCQIPPPVRPGVSGRKARVSTLHWTASSEFRPQRRTV